MLFQFVFKKLSIPWARNNFTLAQKLLPFSKEEDGRFLSTF